MSKDIIEDWMGGQEIDPCEYDEWQIRQLEEFLGEDDSDS